MKFKIVEAPDERLRTTTAIPWQYCNVLSSFAKPKFISSPKLDILYQRFAIKGCILRNMYFNVREAVTLSTSDRNPLVSINCMIKGDLDVQLSGMDKIGLHQGEYNILQMNTDDHALILLPGVYELQRYDYTNRIIDKEKPEWMEKLTRNESAVLEHGLIGEDLLARMEELKHTAIITPEQQDWFYRKMRKYLRVMLQEHTVTLNK